MERKRFVKLYVGRNLALYLWIGLEAVLNAGFVYLSAGLLRDMTDMALEDGLTDAFHGNSDRLILFLLIGAGCYFLKYKKAVLFELRNLAVTERIFGNILELPEEKLAGRDTGDYFQAIHADLKLASSFFVRLDAGAAQIAKSCGAILYVFTENSLIGMALTGLGILILLYQGCIGPGLQKYQQRIQEDGGQVKKLTMQLYKSHEYGQFYDFRILHDQYRAAYDDFLSEHLKKVLWQAGCAVFTYLIGFAQTYLPILLFVVSVQSFSLGNVLAFLNNTVAFMAVFKSLEGIISGLREAMAGMERISPFLEEKGEIRAVFPQFLREKIQIEIKNLNYRYEEQEVLKVESMVLNGRKQIGITGQKGSGKSTFIKVLAGILERYGGSVKINGMEWSSVPAEQKALLIAYLPQNFPVFDMTVLENLRLAAPGKSKEELMRAAEMVNMEQEIKKMPLGIHTPVNAASISTGQRQRLSICMALLRDTPVIMMDEPVSNLDPENKRIIHELIHMKQEKMFLIVSHDKDIFDESFEMYEMNAGNLCRTGEDF